MFLIWLGLVPVMGFCVSTAHAGNLILHMDTVVEILNDVESHLKGTPDLIMAELYQELEFCDSKICQFVLGPMTSRTSNLPYLSEAKRIFLKNLVNRTLDGSQVERGAVLTPDGTTVSMSPLLAGIAAGLKMKNELPEKLLIADPSNSSGEESRLSLDPLISSTISMDLGMAFLLFYLKQSQVALGPNGCWDSISEPSTFLLMGPPSYMTDAAINGAMDGFILGTYLVEKLDPPPNISVLLNDYYGSKGLDGEEKMRSNFRRKSFAALLSKEKLQEQVEDALRFLRKMNEVRSLLEGISDKELTFLAKQAADEFMTMYVECPAIIPRCMWGARPYKGTPTQLKLPLGFVYIHHTSTPSEPCRNFSSCAADMRSMQRFHQDYRDWDDIGYSFVFGSDGYLYQGRGWHWVGAHTRGYNSKGYGISFIGNYMKTLPDSHELELMKNNFIQCAVKGARLQANYTIHGHRQMVRTSCPGDRLFQEIETWKGFKAGCFIGKGCDKLFI
ncbi:N-acetylmuramoyl-L-alanine amidase [Thamnophis elegans]|uniref:N-acetylmuramoyl-L-alanine amidase n=1 Tax=Thamnophis elegans TaxID=35005 RepID=UPI001378FBBC|nr:N-acetylmuramoyl-L-alanine amidase [Thamnophis elegans]XP_032066718.1 N-acetylmuramoyl-L-alanine amidase [Thamnophis elegans]